MDKNQIIEAIKNMNVMERAELVKELRIYLVSALLPCCRSCCSCSMALLLPLLKKKRRNLM